MEPASYGEWRLAETERIVPPVPTTPGQVVYASSRAPGRRWLVHTTVEAVNAERHALDLTTTLPLGITAHNHILCDAVDATSSRVTFG
jgi:hypothetical protein